MIVRKTDLIDLQTKIEQLNNQLWPFLVAAQRGVDTNPHDPAGRARAQGLLAERTSRKDRVFHEIQDAIRVLIERAS